MEIRREPFGKTPAGKQVDTITITNSQGYSITVMTYGAYLISCRMPDREGKIEEITRNHPTLEEYLPYNNYKGATVGRYANRIRGGRFTLDGKVIQLVKTSDACQLHGGLRGFNSKIWEAFPMKYEDRGSVKLTMTSPDGDQGFPGTLDVALTISLTEKNELHFLYEAMTDKATPISLTNHTYWNLRGIFDEGSIYDQDIRINSESIVEVDKDLVPTGVLLPVANTVFDLREFTAIGKGIAIPNGGMGYDNNFVLPPTQVQAPNHVRTAAMIKDSISGRSMEIFTNTPSIQFYTDNFSQPKHAAYCLETGELPDAMNHPDFPSPILRPGDVYRQITIHAFSVES